MQRKAFEAAVAPVRKLLAKGNLPAAEVCLVGNPADELAAYAKKKKLDILVMSILPDPRGGFFFCLKPRVILGVRESPRPPI